MQRYVERVIAHKWMVLAAVAALTLLAGYQISRATIGSSLVRLFFGENEKYAQYEELIEAFGASDITLVAFDDPQLFTSEGFDRLERIADRLLAIEDVRRVQSVNRAQSIEASGEDLVIRSYHRLLDDGVGIETIERKIRQDELLAGLLVSKDGRSTAVVVELEDDPDRTAEALPLLVDAITAPFIDEGIAQESLHIAGLLPESSEVVRMARLTIGMIFPFSSVLLLTIVFALFRRFWPVTITGGVALISVIWTVAFAVVLDRQLNLMIAAVPAVTMIVCFSDIIHLCSAYLLELKAGASKDEAILISTSEVGLACLFTSLTTFVGFAAMAFVPTPAFRQLGLVLGFGVAIALLLALTLVPIAFSLLPEPEQPSVSLGKIGGAVDALNAASMRLATTHPKPVIAAFVLLGVCAVAGISQIRIETNFVDRLDEDNPLRRSRAWISKQFAGTNVLDVYVDAGRAGDALDPKLLTSLLEVERSIETHVGVDRATSLADLIARLADAAGQPGLPDSIEGVSQYLLLFEMADDSGIEQLVDDDRRTLRIGVRLADSGFARTAEIGDWVDTQLESSLPATASATPTGLSYLFGDWLKYIIAGQKRGLLFAVLSTTLMMIICLRSARIGLLSMIPNMLPLAVLGGYLGAAWDSVDTDVALVAMIAIGIGVDDTVHFLTRFRIEALRSDGIDQAIERTFYFTGRAIVQTTIILCAGFLPFLASPYFSTKILGSLLPLTLFVALVADLLLVPALAKVGLINFRR